MKTWALIVAAGSSKRFGGSVPKQFCELCGRPLLAWTIERFEKAGSIDRVVLVVSEEYQFFAGEKVVDPYGFAKVTKIVAGGATRRESVLNGLEALPPSTELVAVHDGARPLTTPKDIDAVVEAAARDKAAMLATRVTDTAKKVKDGYIVTTLDRETLFLAQTPQVFRYDLITAAHREAAGNESVSNRVDITDDAALVEARGHKVKVVEPTSLNLKVTTSQDLLIGEALLKQAADE